MNKFEIMRRIVCGLFVWNLVLTAGFGIYAYNQTKDELDSKICNLEAIPPLEMIEEGYDA